MARRDRRCIFIRIRFRENVTIVVRQSRQLP